MGAELFHVDRQMNRQKAVTKLTVVPHNLANTSKNGSNLSWTKIFTESLLR
jgi:hypothetical protein